MSLRDWLRRNGRTRRSRLLFGVAAVLVLLPILTIEGAGGQRMALWHVVHDLCVVDQQSHNNPAPCQEVDLSGGEADGYVVLKDLFGRTQYLLIPTRRLSGIESPELLAAHAPNYWRAAWIARSYVSQAAGKELPREAIGMAVNSLPGRSQDQLHIHIDCVRTDVADDIRAHLTALTDTWAPLPFQLDGRAYFARRLESADLADVDPFRLLAQAFHDGASDRTNQTLAVIGTTFEGDRPGFVLVAGRANPQRYDPGHSEDLLDHSCAIADTVAVRPSEAH